MAFIGFAAAKMEEEPTTTHDTIAWQRRTEDRNGGNAPTLLLQERAA